ncbi:hypothetical protein C1645_827201 [Glomus cerebriforme]|uniref:Uncharacterized protein n=1 Tax=Glomus cerebriforme TaxID=658196 RepID=A0A397SSE6_9GLOM|nr:hypothetical protein C1645_827201 [Glomus cerebriforme]
MVPLDIGSLISLQQLWWSPDSKSVSNFSKFLALRRIGNCFGVKIDSNSVNYIKSEKISKILTCETFESIISFCSALDDKLYFIIDQIDTLDCDEIDKVYKTEISEDLKIIKQPLIKCVHVIFIKKQTQELKIELYGGEMTEWWKRYGYLLNESEKKQKMRETEDIAGYVSYFLRIFIESNNEDSKVELLNLKRIA